MRFFYCSFSHNRQIFYVFCECWSDVTAKPKLKTRGSDKKLKVCWSVLKRGLFEKATFQSISGVAVGFIPETLTQALTLIRLITHLRGSLHRSARIFFSWQESTGNFKNVFDWLYSSRVPSWWGKWYLSLFYVFLMPHNANLGFFLFQWR